MVMLAGGCLGAALGFIPLAVVAFGAGAAFGLPAIPVVLVASTLGGCIALLLARHCAGPILVRLIGRSRTASALLTAIEHESWRVLGLLRLSSPVPFSLLSYLYGLTRMPLPTFAATTFAGICPAVTFYVYLGWVSRSVIGDEAPVTGGRLLFLVLGGSILIVVATLVGRRTQAILRGVPAA
jgi:uncharacterized membrane protein YdjX (TVP38/TMEM64 family)